MIFMAVTSMVWRSRCQQYEIAALPNGRMHISILCRETGRIRERTTAENLRHAARTCALFDKSMGGPG